MDPNETLANLVRHLVDGDAFEARRYLDYLQEWLDKGGFPPTVPALLELLDLWYDGSDEAVEGVVT